MVKILILYNFIWLNLKQKKPCSCKVLIQGDVPIPRLFGLQAVVFLQVNASLKVGQS